MVKVVALAVMVENVMAGRQMVKDTRHAMRVVPSVAVPIRPSVMADFVVRFGLFPMYAFFARIAVIMPFSFMVIVWFVPLAVGFVRCMAWGNISGLPCIWTSGLIGKGIFSARYALASSGRVSSGIVWALSLVDALLRAVRSGRGILPWIGTAVMNTRSFRS